MVHNEQITSSLVEGIGQIVLNRHVAHNALDAGMINAIHAILKTWEFERLEVVVIRSTSAKAFCAGGDIKAIRRQSLEGQDGLVEDYFAREYAMNAYIAAYPKPIVSLINGFCLGGGMGLSVHGDFRVVSERATLAMPETAIGFFPDVGSTYFLPRLPGSLGLYIGLTGYQLDYRDALYCGLATHYIDADTIESVPAALGEQAGVPIATVLSALGKNLPEPGGHLADHRQEIDWCFSASTVADIGSRLMEIDTPWAGSVIQKMQVASPQSLHVTMSLLQWGAQRSLAQCLQTELQMATAIAASSDFVEGVRAVLVDKDHEPEWTDSSQLLEHLLELTRS